MAIAFRRSFRQAISLAAAGAAAYGTFAWTKSAQIFETRVRLEGSATWGPWVAGLVAFAVSYYVVMIIISGKSAR